MSNRANLIDLCKNKTQMLRNKLTEESPIEQERLNKITEALKGLDIQNMYDLTAGILDVPVSILKDELKFPKYSLVVLEEDVPGSGYETGVPYLQRRNAAFIDPTGYKGGAMPRNKDMIRPATDEEIDSFFEDMSDEAIDDYVTARRLVFVSAA